MSKIIYLFKFKKGIDGPSLFEQKQVTTTFQCEDELLWNSKKLALLKRNRLYMLESMIDILLIINIVSNIIFNY